MRNLRYLASILLLLMLLNGCALFKLPGQIVETAGTAIETVGKVVEATGKAVVAGGRVAETIIKTPGAKEAVINKMIAPK